MNKILYVLSLGLFLLIAKEQKPEENRFEKIVLSEHLNEPLELAVLPDNRVLFIERHGLVKLYSPETNKTTIAGEIEVSTKYNVKKDGTRQEAEDGLLGLNVDPDFTNNNWVYLYYSPTGEDQKNILTRYKLVNNKLDLSSKKIMLEIPVQRDECCHTGGSIAWDSSGNLYLSTGDNTSPRASDGYSPLDERPGRSAFDAQKSSANTNDLRGKILRIKPEDNGTYSIPEGNLFAKGIPNTRPEIYTMGHRNPYRISVDSKTGYVYWGDVGPDSGKDSIGRGPEAEDEYNQAREAGNYGWPYFVGNNKAYWDFDFATNTSGEKFDPLKPINNSPNSTGLKELPEAKKALIWYTAGKTSRFATLGTGGRSAMAGPVFHKEDFENAERPFPDYYDNKLFIYEWMRDWIITVTLNEKGDYRRMERFLPNLKLEHPIDMEFGPNGDLYILEYGQGWFMENSESKLVRIAYNSGNRKPIAMAKADKKVGAAPLTVNLSSNGTTDHDNDPLKYEWKILNSDNKTLFTSKEENISYVFKKKGVFKAILTVEDTKGLQDSQEHTLLVGNEPPVVSLDVTKGNKTFFFPKKSIDYKVNVTDKEDGSLKNKKIKAENVIVTAAYQDVAGATTEGHLVAPTLFTAGKNLMEKSDCKACHFEKKKSIGPSYLDIATKYKSNNKALETLSSKIINGGAGTWGEVAMSPHPNIGLPEANQIVQYILSLSEEKKTELLPVSGSLMFNLPEGADATKGIYKIRASYTDKAVKGMPSQTSSKETTLKSPTLLFGSADGASESIMRFKMGTTDLFIVMSKDSYASFNNIDLSEINTLSFYVAAPIDQLNSQGGIIEVRADAVDGPLLGQTEFISPSDDGALMGGELPDPYLVKLPPTNSMHDLFFVFKNDASEGALFVPYSVTFEQK